MKIYVDNAATTKMSKTAIEAMLPYMAEEYGNPSSLHSVGQRANEALTDARARIAKLLNCEPREITFTSGGSEADNQAILSAAWMGARKGKKHIVSTAFEHHAVLHTLGKLMKEGFEVTLLDVHENGLVTAEEVRKAIRPDTCLVTVMFANNEIGTIQPIAEIGAVCRELGVLFHTDAVQAAGHLHIDVKAQNIDMLSLSAHKFHGPKGVGVLYARKGIFLVNIIEGGAQERGKRAGTENIPYIVGFSQGIEDLTIEKEARNTIEWELSEYTRQKIKTNFPYAKFNGPDTKENCHPGIINVSFGFADAASIVEWMNIYDICISSGSACNTGSPKPSHVLMAIGRTEEEAFSSIRISLSHMNTREEIDEFISAMKEFEKRYKD